MIARPPPAALVSGGSIVLNQSPRTTCTRWSSVARSLLAWAATLAGLGFTSAIYAAEGELLKAAIVNGSFEDNSSLLKGWDFKGSTPPQAADPKLVRSGRSALHVPPESSHWTLTSKSRLSAMPGQRLQASAYVRGGGFVQLIIVGWQKGEVVSPDLGSTKLRADNQWIRLEADAVVPTNVDEVQVQFRAERAKEDGILIDDVSIEQDVRQRQSKPPVQGWAKERVASDKLDLALTATALPDGKVYLSWRRLPADRAAAFLVLRRTPDGNEEFVNSQPILQTTDAVDANAVPGATYAVRGLLAAEGLYTTPFVEVRPPGPRTIKLDANVSIEKLGLTDLDGDGKHDFVFSHPNQHVDPFVGNWKRSTDTLKIDAYRSDGTRLWRNDLGWSIECGVWYSPFLAYDLDGDGKAEVAVKTGEGDPRDNDGRVTSGPEWLSIWDGMTGKEVTRVEWPSRDGFADYNHYNRNQLAVAYLDGKTPCLIVERGTYTTIKVVAYQFHGGKLLELWRWSDAEAGARYRGQGAHVLRAADVDGDGRDEVIIGSAVLDDNGVGLWSTGFGHPDQVAVADLDPQRPGLEIAYSLELASARNGVCMVDAKTGDVLWGLDRKSTHIHSGGMSTDVDARHPGAEIYGGEGDKKAFYLFTSQGQLLSDRKPVGDSRSPLHPDVAFWDADPQREILKDGYLIDFETGTKHEPRIEGEVAAVADLFGDWREEIVTNPPGELRIYSTTIPATDRRFTLLADHIYRMWMACSSSGYYTTPALSRFPGPEWK